MLANKLYETLTPVKQDRKLAVWELMAKRRAALTAHTNMLEIQASTRNPIVKILGSVAANICELKYSYYDGIINQHPDMTRIVSNEFGRVIPESAPENKQLLHLTGELEQP